MSGPNGSVGSGHPRLLVDDVSVRFGGVQALGGVTLSVAPGEIVSLIGPNGAGKTTLFNAVSGLVQPHRGSVLLDGAPIDGASPVERARRGVGRTFQRMQLFEELSVLDNLVVAQEFRLHRRLEVARGLLSRVSTASGHVADAEEMLTFLGIADVAYLPVSEVSTGVRRLVELGRVLLVPGRLTLLDEPSSGLDRAETGRFVDIVRQVRVADPQRSVLIVEHDMAVALELADRVYVLDFGSIIAAGDPRTVRADPAVQRAYLGSEADHV